tara:strand:- start:799 stop:3345 length:2547 start_codon:yes stop_codon:yes gene_type:complete
MLKVIGGAQEGEFKAVASGTLPNGKPVVVNSDGTVSVVEQTASTFGTPVVYESAAISYSSTVYDSTNNRIVISYSDGGNFQYGTSVVGTVNPSSNSITFGTPVTWETGSDVNHITSVYHPTTDTVFIAYRLSVNSTKIVVGEVSGDSITFGSANTITGNPEDLELSAVHDVASDKIVVFSKFSGNGANGRARVITITSKDSQSWGSPVNFTTSTGVLSTAAAYDAANEKSVVLFRDNATTKIVAGTVSGTSITFDTISTVASTGGTSTALGYDSSSEKLLALYYNSSATDMKARVCDASGSSVTFGTEAVLYNANSGHTWVAYDSSSGKLLAFYTDFTDGFYKEATISGTSVTFGSAVEYNDGNTQYAQAAVDTSAGRVVAGFRDQTNSSYGEAVVIAIDPKNLTAENYIGMSRGVAFQSGSAAALGSPTVFESAETAYFGAAFDSNSNRVVFSYQDSGNSNYGTAVVGTISGTSISFGTPVVFESATTSRTAVAFDSNLNKIVIAYQDEGNSSHGTAIVGAVASGDNSISFGSAAVFSSTSTDEINIVFDTNANKFVISYKASSEGKAIVATVSGTSISFGSEATFAAYNLSGISSAFDSNSNKVLLSYKFPTYNNEAGKARVGTVSGTSISFGTEATFVTADLGTTFAIFDASQNKFVVIWKVSSSSYAVVATISGTDVSFGATLTLSDNAVQDYSGHYDSAAQKCIFVYRDSNNDGAYTSFTISGTTATQGGVVIFESTTMAYPATTFDSSAEKSVVAYKANYGATGYGTAVVFNADSRATTRGEVASGGNGSIDIIGSVSDNQIGLIAGQQYFVQIDGTIGTTAGNPSVLAGTAISATKLLVKT